MVRGQRDAGSPSFKRQAHGGNRVGPQWLRRASVLVRRRSGLEVDGEISGEEESSGVEMALDDTELCLTSSFLIDQGVGELDAEILAWEGED